MPYVDYLKTPIGLLEIMASDLGLQKVVFVDVNKNRYPNALTDEAKSQLDEYFSGTRKRFDLPLNAEGTEFQKSVWQALSEIKYGVAQTYSDIANKIGNPKSVRAVGAANGKNPISIIAPCHRVIGANGTLTGYAGGLDRKAWLLKHENVVLF